MAFPLISYSALLWLRPSYLGTTSSSDLSVVCFQSAWTCVPMSHTTLDSFQCILVTMAMIILRWKLCAVCLEFYSVHDLQCAPCMYKGQETCLECTSHVFRTALARSSDGMWCETGWMLTCVAAFMRCLVFSRTAGSLMLWHLLWPSGALSVVPRCEAEVEMCQSGMYYECFFHIRYETNYGCVIVLPPAARKSEPIMVLNPLSTLYAYS